MSEVRGLTPGGGYTPPSLPGDASSRHLVGDAGLPTVDSAKLMAELAGMTATLQAQNPGGVPGVSNPDGAPAIDGVQMEFSPEDMAAALVVLQGKTQEAQLTTAREGLTTNKKKLEEKHQRAMDKINDWIKKSEEAAAKAKAGGIFGWIAKIFGFIGAVFATVVTAGAATPLLALAIVGLAMAVMSLASEISQAAGGPALDMASLIGKLYATVLEACGVPKEKAEKVAAIIAMVAAIVLTVAMIAASCGASVGSAVSGAMSTFAKVGPAVASFAGGAAAAVQGGLNIAKAGDERDAANSQADKKLIDAIIAKLQKQMEDDREDIKKVVQEMMDGMSLVSQMIASAGQSRSQISSNLGKGQTV